MAAHTLASRRNSKMCNFTWVDRPPSSLVHVLNRDGLPCPLDVFAAAAEDETLELGSGVFLLSLFAALFVYVVCLLALL